ncbi:hypothetical protein ACN47A_19755, partial [Myxococcus fulvus]
LGVADTVALLVLAVRFLEPLGNLIELNGALRARDNAITRMQAILDTPALPTPARRISRIRDASLGLTDVTHAYGDTRPSTGCRSGASPAPSPRWWALRAPGRPPSPGSSRASSTSTRAR